MASSDDELETQLMEAGMKLENPPTALDELLHLLDEVEIFLKKVDQSPSEDMQNALSPTLKLLVADQLFKHPDSDVKAAVASCISEITRITAPEAPYDDEQMKKIFQLIVSSFENLSDLSSRSFTKRTSILETVAKVRSCVVMLDLECDSLITEMFQHFLKSIRDDHPESVFASMDTIMSLVLEESEDISFELLSLLLATMKKSGEEVLPIARKLGETVLKNCAVRVKPYLVEAVKSSSITLEDYNEVVASICEESGPDEQNGVHAATEHVVEINHTEADPREEVNHTEEGDKSPKSAVINGVAQTVENDSSTEVDSPKKQEIPPDESKSSDAPNNAEPDNKIEPDNNIEPEKLADAETKKQGQKETVPIKVKGHSPGPMENADEEVKKSPVVESVNMDVPISAQETENDKETSDDSLPPKEGDAESTKKGVDAKEKDKDKDDLNIEAAPSTEDDSTKPSEETRDPEAKVPEGTVEKEPTSSSNEDNSTKPSEETKDSEEKAEKSLLEKETSNEDEPTKPSEEIKDSEAEAQKDSVENEPTSVSMEDKSPALSDSLKKVSHAKKGARSRKKQNFSKKVTASTEDNPPEPSEETSDVEIKAKIGSGKKAPASSSNVDKPQSIEAEKEGELNKEDAPPSEEHTSDVEEKANKGKGKRAPARSSGKKGVQAKKKGKFNKVGSPSAEDNSVKPSEETSDSERKTQKGPQKKAPAGTSDENIDDASSKESGGTTETESKSADKVDDNGEGSNGEEDKNRHSEGERVSERDDSTDEDDKEVVSSPKPAGKSTKKKTPKTNSKRKRTPVTDKASIKEYGDNLVGLKVKVWWPQDKTYYNGVIDSYDSVKKKHRVLYNDGDEEILNLKRQKWEISTGDSEVEEQEEADDEPQPESSSELPLRKKMKATSSSSKKAVKMDTSAKKVGGAFSSKSKGKKPTPKSEDDSDEEGKSKDRTKTSAKSKSKDQTPKTGKSSEVSEKSGSKSKKDDSEKSKATPKTAAKSKQSAEKSKVETPKAASSNRKRKATKLKSTSSDENSDDSADVPVKGKSSASSKAQGTGTKSGKKRARSSKS